MSASNGVIRIGRKGIVKFAFGDGAPFEVDVVVAFQQWIAVDDSFRPPEEDAEGLRSIPLENMHTYHAAAVDFVRSLSPQPTMPASPDLTTAEALDFVARLREQYDELASFFRPKSREKRASPDTSEAELRFSVEGS